jgi:non-homologous end joining protein Ku
VTKEELENVALKSTRTIEIDEFVDRSEIDPRYLIRPYYVRPDGKVGHDAFAVIRETIREMNKVAIGRVVLTNREQRRLQTARPRFATQPHCAIHHSRIAPGPNSSDGIPGWLKALHPTL